jgi:hypothetical protein
MNATNVIQKPIGSTRVLAHMFVPGSCKRLTRGGVGVLLDALDLAHLVVREREERDVDGERDQGDERGEERGQRREEHGGEVRAEREEQGEERHARRDGMHGEAAGPGRPDRLFVVEAMDGEGIGIGYAID